ncbi:MAG: DUF433 domain-containing protein [Bryobacteraceae bacterium]
METIPCKRSGAWVFRETRTPVSVVFDNLEAGASIRRDPGLVPFVAQSGGRRGRVRGSFAV